LNILQFIVPEQREIAKANVERSLRGLVNAPNEYKILRKDGTSFSVLARTAPIISEGKLKGLRGIVIDITDRKEAEESIRLSEEKYRSLFENASDVIITGDLDGKIVSVNEAVKEYGFSKEQMIGKNVRDFLPKKEIEIQDRRSMEISNGKSFSWELEVSVPVGNRILEVKTDPLRIGDKVVGFQTILRDVTIRREMEKKLEEYSKGLEMVVETRTGELKQTQQQLLKTERLAAIGELAGMIGHDLRNPLCSMKNACYYLKKKGMENSEMRTKEMLDIIEKSILHSDKIINNLVEYSSELRLGLRESSPSNLLAESLAMLALPKEITVVDKTSEKPTLSVDIEKMKQVFVKVIQNAVDAMPQGGILQVSSYQEGDNVEISFSDTGTGIKEEVLQRMFSPLFTTKAQGMGFGLAISKRIVSTHGGKISAETTLGKGTTIKIVLPIEPSLVAMD